MVDAVTADIQVGEVLDGRYRVEGLIARGGMAAVYRAMDQRLDRTVAVKVIHPAYAADASFVDRFVREALNVAKLSHPNVVAVYDQGSHQGLAYLVMEYVPGRTLRSLLTERGRLSAAEAAGVLEPLLAGLAAAHRIGMVHRDVKPENVLIGTDGVVKVADFGLARLLATSRVTSRSIMLGTVAYVSPEVVTSGTSEPTADVYAAGIVLFEMLTGAAPFAGDSPVAVAFQHVNDEVPAPSKLVPDVSPALDTVVLRATRRDPRARPADADAMLAELRGAGPLSHTLPTPRQSSHTQPLPTSLLEPVSEPPRQARSRRWMLVAAAVVAMVLLVAGVTWWVNADRTTAVPSLIGSTQAQAEAKIRGAGLVVRYGTPAFDEKAPVGSVLRQLPKAGAEVAMDSAVVVVLSKGPQLFVVPTVVGKRRATAEKAIRNASLTPKVTTAYNDDTAAGRVVSSTPVAGTKLRRRAVVQLVVSLGPRPSSPLCIDIPSLLPPELRDRLRSLGC